MLGINLNKETMKQKPFIFLVVVAVFFLAIIWKSIPPLSLSKTIKMTISKQKGSIQSIDEPRNPDFKMDYMIDLISFDNANELIHERLGKLGYSNDFFMDLETEFEVKIGGDYVFTTYSDDGFRLFIDGAKVSEFLGSRPFDKTEGTVNLTKGRHRMLLNYYQGYGLLGLKAMYRLKSETKDYIMGASSKYISF